MKKILIRVALIILAVILAIVIAAYFLLFRDPGADDVRSTIVDAEGNTYIAVTDKDGNTFAIVADEKGDRWEVEVKDDGSLGSTVENVNDEYAITDIITTYAGPAIDESVDSDAFTGNVIEDNSKQNEDTTQGTTAPSSQSDNQTSTTESTTAPTTTAPTSEKDDSKTANIIRYQKMFSSGTYYMEFTTNDKELGDTPIVAAAKNGNILIKTNMDGMDCSMLYLADKDKTYLLLDNYKKYCSVPQSMLGDDFNMSSFNLMESFADEVSENAIKTDNVEINGKTLVRESYTTADGSTMRYYFDNGVLVRLDNESDEGNVETYISKITNDVPDSTFSIPKNYGYLNLSWLDFLG